MMSEFPTTLTTCFMKNVYRTCTDSLGIDSLEHDQACIDSFASIQ